MSLRKESSGSALNEELEVKGTMRVVGFRERVPGRGNGMGRSSLRGLGAQNRIQASVAGA